MTTLTAEPDRIDLDHATGACIVRLREERDAAVAALRDRDATIARLTAAVEALRGAVREFAAAEAAYATAVRAALRESVGLDALARATQPASNRVDAARAALAALTGGAT